VAVRFVSRAGRVGWVRFCFFEAGVSSDAVSALRLSESLSWVRAASGAGDGAGVGSEGKNNGARAGGSWFRTCL